MEVNTEEYEVKIKKLDDGTLFDAVLNEYDDGEKLKFTAKIGGKNHVGECFAVGYDGRQ